MEKTTIEYECFLHFWLYLAGNLSSEGKTCLVRYEQFRVHYPF